MPKIGQNAKNRPQLPPDYEPARPPHLACSPEFFYIARGRFSPNIWCLHFDESLAAPPAWRRPQMRLRSSFLTTPRPEVQTGASRHRLPWMLRLNALAVLARQSRFRLYLTLTLRISAQIIVTPLCQAYDAAVMVVGSPGWQR